MSDDDDQAGLSGSKALDLLAEAEEDDRELRRLREGLVALLEGGEPCGSHSS